MNVSNEVKIGVIVVAAILLSYFGFKIMRDVPLIGVSNDIVAHYDRVDGLSAGSIVYLKGVKIGSVKSMELQADDSIRVVITLDGDWRLPVGSVARIVATSIIDGKAIAIEKSDATETIPYGGRITGVYDVSVIERLGGESEAITDDVTRSISELSTFTASLNELLDERNRAALSGSFDDLARTTSTVAGLLERKQDEIEGLIDAANSTLSQLDTLATDNRERIDSLMTDLETAVAELTSTSEQLSATLETLNSILVKIDEGQGSMGLLVNDPSLYQNLDSLAAELKVMTRGINENPRRYLKHLRFIELF